MSLQSTIPAHWHRWLLNQPHLPAHLPRLVLHPRFQPRYVRQCEVTQQLLPLLQRLDWEQLPATLTWRCRSSQANVADATGRALN